MESNRKVTAFFAGLLVVMGVSMIAASLFWHSWMPLLVFVLYLAILGAFSLLSVVVFAPVLKLIGRLTGRATQDDRCLAPRLKTNDAIVQFGGWIPRQRHGRPRTRRAAQIAFGLLIGVTIAVLWLCRVTGIPTQQEHPILLRSGDVLAWLIILIDLALWIRTAILGMQEPPRDFEEMVKNPDVDQRKLY